MRLHVLACCCAVNQYSKITGTFLRFQTEERIPKVNEIKIVGKNTFNGDHFETETNHESRKDKKALFWVFLQIYDQSLTL